MEIDLFIDISSQETGYSTVVRIGREKGRAVLRPGLVDVLKNDARLTYRLVIMDQNWDFLVDWIGLKKEITHS